MKALKGDVPTRARDVVAAGCDIALNCWGRMDEMVDIADILGDISDKAQQRLDHAMATLDVERPEAEFAELLCGRAHVCTPVTDQSRMPSSAWKKKTEQYER